MRVLSILTVLAVVAVARADDPEQPADPKQAVAKGVAFLRKEQREDGSWTARNRGAEVAVTALTALALMSAGDEPGKPPAGEAIDRAVEWLVQAQDKDGLFHTPATNSTVMYGHGMATLALTQAAALAGG